MEPMDRLIRLAALARAPGLLGRIRRTWDLYRTAGWPYVHRQLRRHLSDDNNYTKWVARYDALDDRTRSAMGRRMAQMAAPPLISVVMPTYSPNAAWLCEAIESVRRQNYPNWELCIADDASPNAETKAILRDYAARDVRIKVVFREQNGHISAASNSALELAAGTWVALMDHDDLLPEHALYCVADCIDRHPRARLIYSDEDKIDESGRRFDPYFKPDWNLDLFRSQNMFSHLGVLAADLVREVGGFRVGMEGSQDWDLVLRCIERIEANQIEHVPRVLYHWRVHGESTAKSMGAKPYAALAGERALDEHFARTGVKAQAEYVGTGYRARFELPDEAPLVSILIPTRNEHDLVRRCIESIVAKTSYPRYEIVLIDKASGDPATLDRFADLAERRAIGIRSAARECNYAELYNAAAQDAAGDLLALVGIDVEILSPDWLSEMVSLALQRGVGAVGARLWDPTMLLRHAGIILGMGDIFGHAHRGIPAGNVGYGGRAALIQNFSAVTGGCLVIRRSAYLQVDGMDAEHLKIAFNDVDLCLRLGEAGLRTVWTPYAELLHRRSALGRKALSPDEKGQLDRDASYMRQRWGDVLARDPAYNPNLTLDSEDFSYAWPPRVEPL